MWTHLKGHPVKEMAHARARRVLSFILYTCVDVEPDAREMTWSTSVATRIWEVW
jgi:hypothetical protein